MSDYLVLKNQVRNASKSEYEIMLKYARLSKNVYNTTIWHIRNHYESNNKYLGYTDAYHVMKEDENFKKIATHVGQQTMKLVDRNFKSFFKQLKKKQQEGWKDHVGMPWYLPSDGYQICIFPSSMIKKVDGKRAMRLSLGEYFKKEYDLQFLYFDIPEYLREKDFKEVRLIPQLSGHFFDIEFVYKDDKSEVIGDLDYSRYLGIDLGLDNFATCVSNTSDRAAFILEGKGLKSFNYWWNKKQKRLQSVYDKQGHKKGIKKNEHFRYRFNYLDNWMNHAVRTIIDYCIDNKIGNLVIGDWQDMKQKTTMGRNGNHKFYPIPYGKFKQKLESKCERYGIKYKAVEESYTSQKCASCGTVDASNRKYRGLYVCDCGFVGNADANGAVNIVRKVSPEFLSGIGSNGQMACPVRISVL